MSTTGTHNLTAAACEFVELVRFDDFPEDAVRVGRRCILDGLALFIAGSVEPAVKLLIDEAFDCGGREDALLLASGSKKVPAPMAARVLGTAGHVHDWNDTQVSRDPRHQYGMLTHPTIPVLSASLAAARKRGGVGGRDFVTAFLTEFEVECKIAEFMLPGHYTRGFHSSGTVGNIGAAAAKLLGLRGRTLASAIGLAASFAAGIRANYGTMTKPLHVGRAAENGVTAALLSARGFTADATTLDGRWGFFQIFGGGIFEEKAVQGFGETFSIVDPGVSIKPYPSGILTHQTMDALLTLIKNRKIDASDVEHITVFVGGNILDPIRYPKASNYLEAKFSMAALLAMIVLRRRA